MACGCRRRPRSNAPSRCCRGPRGPGMAEAEYRVGRCYLEGAGVPVSRTEGARWLERAASQGFIEAQALLATLYLHGLAAEAAGIDDGSAANLFTSNSETNAPDFVAAEKWARRAVRRRFGRGPGAARLHPDLRAGGDAQPAGGIPVVRALRQRPTAHRATSATPCRWPMSANTPEQAGQGHRAPARRRRFRPAHRAVPAGHDHRTRPGREQRTCKGPSTITARPRRRGTAARRRVGALALLEGRGVEANLDRGRILAAPRRAGRRSRGRRPGRRPLRQGRQAAAELCGSRHLVPSRRRGQPSRRRPRPGHAAHDRRRRAARLGGGGALVPRRRRGRRPQCAGGTGQSVAEGNGWRGGLGPHPRMVRAGGGVRRPGRGVQFRRLPGGRSRGGARRPQGRGMAAPGGGRRGECAVPGTAACWWKAAAWTRISRKAAPGSSAPPMSACRRPRCCWRR